MLFLSTLAIVALAGIGAFGDAPAGQGMAAQRRTIFGADSGRPVPSAIVDPQVVRQRETDADLTFLSRIGAPAGPWALAPARSVALNLFQDADVIALLDRVETVSTLGHAWVGTVVGVEDS